MLGGEPFAFVDSLRLAVQHGCRVRRPAEVRRNTAQVVIHEKWREDAIRELGHPVVRVIWEDLAYPARTAGSSAFAAAPPEKQADSSRPPDRENPAWLTTSAGSPKQGITPVGRLTTELRGGPHQRGRVGELGADARLGRRARGPGRRRRRRSRRPAGQVGRRRRRGSTTSRAAGGRGGEGVADLVEALGAVREVVVEGGERVGDHRAVAGPDGGDPRAAVRGRAGGRASRGTRRAGRPGAPPPSYRGRARCRR